MNLTTWLKESSNKLQYQECVYIAKSVLEVEIINGLELSIIAEKCLNYALEQRIKGMPLSKIIQKKHFMESAFITTKDTLDPRPETEFLIESVAIKPRSILDLGTGTGCIAISLIKKFPKAKAIAVDISADALKIAKKNAVRLNCEKKIQFIENNWANGMKDHFDLVISNPPYVSLNEEISIETKNDPATALIGTEKTYQDLWHSMQNITFKEFILEVPENLLISVQNIFKNEKTETKQVYNTKIYMLKIIR